MTNGQTREKTKVKSKKKIIGFPTRFKWGPSAFFEMTNEPMMK